MRFIKIGLTAAIIAAGFLVGDRMDAQEQGDRRMANTLTVNGTGESNAAPDIAFVTVGVVTTGKKAQEASQANAAATSKVVAALRALGIPEKDVQTSGYSVSPQYNPQPNPRREGPEIIGYHVSNNVRATIRKLDSIGKAIDAALEAGANNVHGVGFGLEKRDAADSQAIEDAVKDARRKADTLARAAGVRITGVHHIQEGQIFRPMPMMETAMFGRGGAAKVDTPISPGELTVSANVTVVYNIAPGAGADKGGGVRAASRKGTPAK